MKANLDLRRQTSELGILALASLGILALTRTALSYGTKDTLSLLITLLMGVGFVLGVAELLVRSRRARRIAAEANALPAHPSEEAIDRVSPDLRAFLRARIENAGTPPARESFTGYLVGLMVMLGLLGTLLGLFETLNGAGHALTESTNVDALRNGLSAPMRGLTRSFGCSAAGVTASAILGLAAVLARRLEARASAVVHAYANGPLRELSPVRRQLFALDRLAAQGEAWPRAADALAQVSEQLGTLAARWETAHAQAVTAQKDALDGVLEKLRADLAQSASQTATAMYETVAPLVKQSVAQTGEAAARHFGAVMEAFERDLKSRQGTDDDLRKAIREELSAMRKWAEADARARADESTKQIAALDHAMKKHAQEQAALLSLHRDQANAHVAAISEAARALNVQLDQESVARRNETSALLGDLGRRMDESAALRAQESQRELEAITRLGEQLVREGEAREQSIEERWGRLLDKLEEDRRRAIAVDVERSQQVAARLEEQQKSLIAAWAQLGAGIEAATERSQAKDEQRMAALASVADSLSKDLGRAAQRIESELEARAAFDASQAERAKEALETLRAGANALEESLAKQELAVTHLLEEGARQLAHAGGSAQVQAEAALARIVDLATNQAERFAQLEAALQQNQSAHAKALADELTSHADRLGKSLEGTTSLVREAGDLLKASSVEMGAVAEMFAKGVERQREAATAWMESLGELEGAIERSGRSAAADALGDQLASTQEVFARQLQFQRELFEQLRTLRTPTTPSRAEQADVSA